MSWHIIVTALLIISWPSCFEYLLHTSQLYYFVTIEYTKKKNYTSFKIIIITQIGKIWKKKKNITCKYSIRGETVQELTIEEFPMNNFLVGSEINYHSRRATWLLDIKTSKFSVSLTSNYNQLLVSEKLGAIIPWNTKHKNKRSIFKPFEAGFITWEVQKTVHLKPRATYSLAERSVEITLYILNHDEQKQAYKQQDYHALV